MSTTTPLTTSVSSRRARGFEILLVIIYAIFALSATARSLVQIVRDFGDAPVAYSLSLFAALTYIAVTVLLVRRGRRSPVVLILVAIELVGVLAVGTLSVAVPSLFPDATVWSTYGIGYGFVPLALPLVALSYLMLSRYRDVLRPRRLRDHVR